MSFVKNIARRSRLALLLVTLLPYAAVPQHAVTPDDFALLEKLRAGGYTIYFRHAATDWSQSDHVQKTGDWRSCDSQRMRQLSAAGRATTERVGQAMRKLRIPVQHVLASPYCRTVQTAELLQVGAVVETNAVINMRAADYFGGRDVATQTAREVLATAPKKGTNAVIVAHGNVAIATFGFRPAEGEAVILQPESNGRYEVAGRLTPAAFEALAKHTSP